MTGPAAITLVLVGTLRARIPTVVSGSAMFVLASPTAIPGVCFVTLARAAVSSALSLHVALPILTGPAAITLVLVGTLRARIPTVGTGCDMVVLKIGRASCRDDVGARGGREASTASARDLEAIDMTGPAATTHVVVGTLLAGST